MLTFQLTIEQQNKLDIWAKEQDNIVLAQQLNIPNTFIREEAAAGRPYYGAIGGALVYSFVPHSLGVTAYVTHQVTKNKIDLTDYDNW